MHATLEAGALQRRFSAISWWQRSIIMWFCTSSAKLARSNGRGVVPQHIDSHWECSHNAVFPIATRGRCLTGQQHNSDPADSVVCTDIYVVKEQSNSQAEPGEVVVSLASGSGEAPSKSLRTSGSWTPTLPSMSLSMHGVALAVYIPMDLTESFASVRVGSATGERADAQHTMPPDDGFTAPFRRIQLRFVLQRLSLPSSVRSMSVGLADGYAVAECLKVHYELATIISLPAHVAGRPLATESASRLSICAVSSDMYQR